MREKYEELQAEVLSFENVDVITTSVDPTETNNH